MRSLVVLATVLAVSIAAPQYSEWPGYGLEEPFYKGEPVFPYPDDYSPGNVGSLQDGQSEQYEGYGDGYMKKKRSIGYGLVVPNSPVLYNSGVYIEPAVRTVYAAPATTVYASPVALPSAVSHQSRVDVRNSPAVVAVEPVAAVVPSVEVKSVPVLTPSPSYTVYAGGSAVSQQSRVDVKSSPAVVTEQVVQPAVVAPTVIESSPAVVETAPALVEARSVYYSPVTAYAHQQLVQVPNYYAQQVVSPLLFKKKREV